jgi:arylsulfatase
LLLASAAIAAERPNILLILADDLGFSDLGCYGGEIATPHLDRLASGGLRFTQFYNATRCCPTRASLQTGLYPHQAGVGNMTDDRGVPGYRGRLTDETRTLAEAMRDAGYYTAMSGKWHLSKPGPIERGYEDYYGMLHGFDSFWDESVYTRLPADRPRRTYEPGRFHATDAITDHALEFIARARSVSKPFFLYLAYNAPHFPLHAPKELIDRYVPVYEQGWDAIRAARHERMKRLGLVQDSWALSPRSDYHGFQARGPHGTNPPWESLPADRRADLARRMATYAAMVDQMDRNIGRVLDQLAADGRFDNTLILFLSDNGACAEWDPFGFDIRSGPENVLHTGGQLASMGQPGTYHSYGSGWANACNTPWRLYKHYGHEGGISTPFIAHWPARIPRGGQWRSQVAHLIDVMPTCLEVAGGTHPAKVGDRALTALEGVSLIPAFDDRSLPRVQPLFWEHEGNRAARDGKWKLVSIHEGPWELYDIEADRVESRNLASEHPERVAAMARQWEAWAVRAHVLPKPPPNAGKSGAKKKK